MLQLLVRMTTVALLLLCGAMLDHTPQHPPAIPRQPGRRSTPAPGRGWQARPRLLLTATGLLGTAAVGYLSRAGHLTTAPGTAAGTRRDTTTA